MCPGDYPAAPSVHSPPMQCPSEKACLTPVLRASRAILLCIRGECDFRICQRCGLLTCPHESLALVPEA